MSRGSRPLTRPGPGGNARRRPYFAKSVGTRSSPPAPAANEAHDQPERSSAIVVSNASAKQRPRRRRRGNHARFDGRVARALQRMRAQTMGVNRAVARRASIVAPPAAAVGVVGAPSLHKPRRRRSRTRICFGATFSPTRAPTLKPTATPDYGFVPGWASTPWAAPHESRHSCARMCYTHCVTLCLSPTMHAAAPGRRIELQSCARTPKGSIS